MKKSYKVALGGMVSALSVVIMFMTGVIPFVTLAFPLLAGYILLAVIHDISLRWAFVVYISVSFLSFMLVPDREAALIYIGVFGLYPIIRSYLERHIKDGRLRLIIKVVFINLSILSTYLILIFVLQLQEVINSLAAYGEWTVLILFLAANFVMLLYDASMPRLTYMYVYRIRDKLVHSSGGSLK